MIILGFYLLKACIGSGLLYLYYHLALRNKVFHQWNRFYLLVAVVISLTAPLLQFQLFAKATPDANPSVHLLRVVQSANEYLDEVIITKQTAAATGQWGLTLYLSVSIAFFLLLLHSLVRIFSIIRSHVVQQVAGIRFINTSVEGAPFSFFRYIFWNKAIDIQSHTGQQIFQHELVHVKEKHSLDKLFMQIILAVFWCNPFFWLIRRELKLIHEFIADRKSVAEHGTATFAAMVLQSSFPQHYDSLVNSFFQTSIKRRILMLKKLQTPRLSYLSRVLALPVLVCTVLAFTLKTKHIQILPVDKSITVVIDAGHGVLPGGKTDGAVVNGVSEGQIVLALAKKIQQDNQDKNIHIVLTRSSSETVELHQRVDIARDNKADLFLSLHMGANLQDAGASSVKASTQGIDIYVSDKEPFYQKQSELFGSVLQQELSTVYEVNPDLLKRKVGIWVLDQNVCPSVLLECGFITNEKDRNFISSDKNQEALARKILSSIEYFAALRNQPSVADTIPLSKRANTDNLMVGDLKINYVPASKTKAPYYHVTGGNIVVNKQKIKINDAEIEMPMDTVPVTEPVFQKVEIEAGISKTTWANFLSTHLDDVLHSLAQKAPPGQYTAYMRFIVKKDGSLVDPTVVKDPGYGVGEKLVEVLKQSPRWLPAYQNGKPVNSYHTQPITLVIAAQ